MSLVDLVNTIDARVWAAEFIKYHPEMADEKEAMIGWFSNSLMTGYDFAVKHYREENK